MTDYSPVAPLFATDAYKLDHRRQYPPGTTGVYSNWTNRSNKHMPDVDHVVHFGLQAYIQQHLMDAWEPFFNYPSTGDVMRLYTDRVAQVMGREVAEEIGADHIGDLHELGYLPLRFAAVPEGTQVPIGVPSFTVENTLPRPIGWDGEDPNFAWVTNYVETGLSAGYWLPSTSATIAHAYRGVLDDAARRTGADPGAVDYQLHDFSFRGMSSHESAAASAAGHLLSFVGTDSLVTLDWIDRYYGGDYSAKSIPATEHSVMSAGTAVDSEFATFERLLDLYPTGNLAIVSDTYNLWTVITDFLPRLKDKILARDGKLVIRPDSGDPEKILLGDIDGKTHQEQAGVVRLLARIFGVTINSAGFTQLDPHIGVIYGDSITLTRAKSITDHLEAMGMVSTTVTLGVGSFSYQYQTRDTFGSAMKATWAEINGKGVDLFKDPITDDGTKRSARGRLAVARDTARDARPGHPWGELILLQQVNKYAEEFSLLKPIWENGKFLQYQTFEDVRRILNAA